MFGGGGGFDIYELPLVESWFELPKVLGPHSRICTALAPSNPILQHANLQSVKGVKGLWLGWLQV